MAQIPQEHNVQKQKNIDIMQPMSDAGRSSLTEDGMNCFSNLPTH